VRRRRRRNPSTETWAGIFGGVTLLAVGASVAIAPKRPTPVVPPTPGYPTLPAGQIRLEQGTVYSAAISLSFPQSLASNGQVADKLAENGFTNVRVSGSGGDRQAQGTWSRASGPYPLPEQVTNVQVVTPASPATTSGLTTLQAYYPPRRRRRP
jgi:hypothetical protein